MNHVLNNQYALSQLEIHLALGGLQFEGETLYTKPQITDLLERKKENALNVNGLGDVDDIDVVDTIALDKAA